MKPHLLKLCLFGILAGTGNRIRDLSTNKEEIRLARELSKLGNDLITKSKIKINRKAINQSYKKIKLVYPNNEAPEPCEVISFIFLGLSELYILNKRPKLLNDALATVLGVLKFYDPKLENENTHIIAANKYFFWEG